MAFQKDAVRRLDEHTYLVKSQTQIGGYVIITTRSGWKCNCPDHTFRKAKCKHVWAVEYSIELRREVEANITVIPAIKPKECIHCGSNSIVKDGVRHNKRVGDIQKYNCKNCNSYFTINLGFERMRASPQAITSAMQLYFTVESLRNVQKFLQLQGLKVNHMTIYRWIKKYCKLMEGYLEKIKPQVSDAWRPQQ